MKINKKIMLIPILIGIMFVLPLISAGTTIVNSPVAYNNYTTLTVNCTSGI